MDQKALKNSIFARMAGTKSNKTDTSSYNNINDNKMDSKVILNKIITMLGMDNKNVELGGNANAGGPFYGKLEGGAPVMTDYFAVGHVLLVIKEDGSKVAAPDAEHIIYLPTGLASGDKRYFITTKDGIITSMHLEDNHGAKKVNVNFASESEKENQMETIEKQAAEVDLQYKSYKEGNAVKKEEKMQDEESRLDSLEEQVNQLRKDIAQVFESMKEKEMKKEDEEMKKQKDEEEMKKKDKEEMAIETRDEKEAVKKLQDGPKDGATKMSTQKKFNGAPVEEKTNLSGIVKAKPAGTMASVLDKIYNGKFASINNKIN